MVASLSAKLQGLVSLFWRELAKFGVVGGLSFVIDSGLTWYLFHGPMAQSEVKAKIIATIVATVFAWFGNRYWTFRHRRNANVVREGLMFALMNGVGLAISAGCVIVAKYVFNVQSPSWLFFYGSIVGTALGTIFRWFAYRFWVFNEELDKEPGYSQDRVIFDEGNPHANRAPRGASLPEPKSASGTD